MRGTDKLREQLGISVTKTLIAQICDEIDHELESEYVKLPVDADGVTLHIGDEVTLYGPYDYKVRGISFYDDRVCVSYRSEHGCGSDLASRFHHYRKPTLEDVLREFKSECCDVESDYFKDKYMTGKSRDDRHESLISDYAAKIRDVMAQEVDQK